jgi:hypothetical protein
MFKERDVLTEYRLLEFPNETGQSWPIASRKGEEPPIRVLARDPGRSAGGTKKVAA